MSDNSVLDVRLMVAGEVSNPFNVSDVPEDVFGGKYTGKVVDNKDPEKIGRCKIKVYGVFDEVADDDLPWSAPEFDFVGSLAGSFVVPPIGCMVGVTFEDGDLYLPRYSKKVVDISKLPKNRLKNYPHTMVMYETDKGSVFEIDRQTDEVLFTHSSGTTISIDMIGNVKCDPVGTYELTSKAVIPADKGALNCIWVCPYSGAFHAGTVALPGV